MPPDAIRLQEIAQRHLRALGIPTELAADGTGLVGELSGVIRNPLGGIPFERVGFVVEGHDKLRAVSPAAFAGLPAISFIELKRPEPLLSELEALLKMRAASAQAAFDEMRRLRLSGAIDPQLARAIVKLEITALGTVVLEGDERGVRATRLLPLHGKRGSVLLDVPVDLREHRQRIDLELFLYNPVEAALVAPPPPARAASALLPPGEGITLGQLVEKFGPDARLEPGLALVRDLALGARRLRISASLDVKGGFVCRLQEGAAGPPLWEGGYDPAQAPRIEEFIAARLGMEAPPPDLAALAFTLGPAAAVVSHDLVAGQMKPVAGEVWVMSILLESDRGGEVRYLPVDIDGNPYGAPRTMPRPDFLATFEAAGIAGYRLPAKVLEVSETHVTWVQLDPKRQTVGKAKSGTLPMFVHHFVPEAAAY